MENDEKIISAGNEDIDATLEDISAALQSNETLILEVGDNLQNQTDKIYDTLIMRGYNVRESFRKGKKQIIVNKKQLS